MHRSHQRTELKCCSPTRRRRSARLSTGTTSPTPTDSCCFFPNDTKQSFVFLEGCALLLLAWPSLELSLFVLWPLSKCLTFMMSVTFEMNCLFLWSRLCETMTEDKWSLIS